MSGKKAERISYCLLDPTGNITALVESEVGKDRRISIAARIMCIHPEVEQVGFMSETAPGDRDVRASLHMAGGEFCGNATMCAAALQLIRETEAAGCSPEDIAAIAELSDQRPADLAEEIGTNRGGRPWSSYALRVSGAVEPVRVRLRHDGSDCFSAGVHMPPAISVEMAVLDDGKARTEVPMVRMEGISHLIIEENSPFFYLKTEREAAQRTIRDWCGRLSADGLGLMFLEQTDGKHCLTPLVYVREGETLFWEHSCASGSAAVGMFLSDRCSEAVSLDLQEPGGMLHVESDPRSGETWLYGRIRDRKSTRLNSSH